MNGTDDILSAAGISKNWRGVSALAEVSLSLRRGEIHALVGENGAGKSTLIKILSGDATPDIGALYMNGKPVAFSSPREARRHGIVTIFQELAVVPWLSVAENIVLGAEPTVGWGAQLLSRRRTRSLARAVLDRIAPNSGIDVDASTASLSTAQKQLVEIGRALVLKAPIVIMDEPTASLAAVEAEALIRLMRQLRDEGTAILFVSHRLQEVLSVANRVTVFRSGKHVATLPATNVTQQTLIEMMIGRSMAELYPPRNREMGDVVLSVRNFSRAGAFEDISFDVRAGEVLGFAGLVGAGRTEAMRALFGIDARDGGTVTYQQKPLAMRSPADAIRAGFGLVPEDRKDQGLILSLSGRENLAIAADNLVVKAGVLRHARLGALTDALARDLSVRGDLDAEIATLSGGNQQKIVFGKWLMAGARVLILDEPTRGVDVGAKAEIYRLIQERAKAGTAVILISSELPELLHVAHRIIVMSGGRIQDQLDEAEFEERRILAAAFTAHLGSASNEQTTTNLAAV
jgi:ABC-type sugar transport system ATPase subunit